MIRLLITCSKYFSPSDFKTRYYIPYDKHTIELDIYEGIFKGLIVAEVEFESLDEANLFTPPAWFGEDISNNIEYRNKILATKY